MFLYVLYEWYVVGFYHVSFKQLPTCAMSQFDNRHTRHCYDCTKPFRLPLLVATNPAKDILRKSVDPPPSTLPPSLWPLGHFALGLFASRIGRSEMECSALGFSYVRWKLRNGQLAKMRSFHQTKRSDNKWYAVEVRWGIFIESLTYCFIP